MKLVKRYRGATHVAVIALSIVSLLMNMAAPAMAGPRGGQVVRGDVDIQQAGTHTDIRASHNAIINFQSFDINANESVRFIQPSDTARVLNRVLDGNPTRINGSLSANGHVYIANRSGVFFGGNAVINVGSLTAAAADITDENFLNNIDVFSNVSGPVINEGNIAAKHMVNLIGSRVANYGAIAVPDGTVTMVAGDDVYLQPRDGGLLVRLEGGSDSDGAGEAAVTNEGSIDAGANGRVVLGAADIYALAAEHKGTIRGGDVTVEGNGGRVNVTGSIDASNDDGNGGTVRILAEEIALYDGASIDASGATGDGAVYIGGEYQGGGDLPTATRTYIDPSVNISASAMTSGDGGTVIVWADEATYYAGTITAMGGSLSGDGGFVEVSGKISLGFNGVVNTDAPAGATGTVLLDPTDVTFDNSGSVLGGDVFFGNSLGTALTFLASSLVALLDGNNVTVQASNDVTFSADVDATLNTGNGDLFVYAGRRIIIDPSVTINLKGSFTAVANAGERMGVVPADRTAGSASFTMGAGSTITTAN